MVQDFFCGLSCRFVVRKDWMGRNGLLSGGRREGKAGRGKVIGNGVNAFK